MIFRKTENLHVNQFIPLIAPVSVKQEMPMTRPAAETVFSGRETVKKILKKQDERLLVITGPCSIHDEKAAVEYARKLVDIKKHVDSTMFLLMRVYFEKPRTTIGWKGLINDPFLNGSCNITEGIKKARRLLLDIAEMGLSTATEMLDPVIPQYIADLICWTAVGARTTESQTHREMSSGLSMPVGFKNCTDGDLENALNAMLASRAPQSFIGIDEDGKTCIVKTTGNPWTHIVLRGGRRPNYDSVSIAETQEMLREKKLPQSIMVDCSHGNSRKKYQNQPLVWQDVINQRLDGNHSLVGLMLESNLNEGSQNVSDPSDLKYGVSITDECISWATTERLLLSADKQIRFNAGSNRPSAEVERIGRYAVA